MTRSFRPARLTPALLALLLCPPLRAEQTGDIGFQGALTESACAVSAPARTWVELPGPPGSAPDIRDIPLDLSIEVCTPHVFDATAMNLNGDADEDDDSLLALLREPGAATGFGIAVYDLPGNLIPPGGPVPDDAFSRVSETRVMLPLRARYAETRSSVTPGRVSSHAVIAVEHH